MCGFQVDATILLFDSGYVFLSSSRGLSAYLLNHQDIWTTIVYSGPIHSNTCPGFAAEILILHS